MSGDTDEERRHQHKGTLLDAAGHHPLNSGRMGQHAGVKARTFHLAITSARRDIATPKGVSVDYLDRLGAYAHKGEDLVASGGRTAEEMKAILAAAEAATTRRNGRVAIGQVIELPAAVTAQGHVAIATAVAEALERQGYPVHWAIHRDPQPHMHLVSTARPVGGGHGAWEVASEGRRGQAAVALFRTRQSVREWRTTVATIITHQLETEGHQERWHGGRDAEMDQPGITGRAPKKRIPERQWHREGQRVADPIKVAQKARQKAQERDEAVLARWEREKARAASLATRAKKAGFIPPSEANRLRIDKRVADRVLQEVYDERNQAIDQAKNLEEALAAARADLEARKVDNTQPATFKQLAYAVDLAKRKGLMSPFNENSDAPATKAEVGVVIRYLEGRPDVHRRLPSGHGGGIGD